jgi:uncharacterized protein (AIM24 family)
MNYDGAEYQIVSTIQTMQANNSNTLDNLKSMFGDTEVYNLVSKGTVKIIGNKVVLSNQTKKDITPLDLTENSIYKNDKRSSLLFS